MTQIDSSKFSPNTQVNQSRSSKFIRRKPDYPLYNKLAEQRHKKTDDKSFEFAGFYSPTKSIEPLKAQISQAMNISRYIVRSTRNGQDKVKSSSNSVNQSMTLSENNPQVCVRARNPQPAIEVATRTCNKQNSKQRASSSGSRGSFRHNQLIEDNVHLRKQVQLLKQQNNLLHSQIKNNHSELQRLIIKHKEDLEMRKTVQSLQNDIKQKQQKITSLDTCIASLNKRIEELQASFGSKRHNSYQEISNLEEINSQNLVTIMRLTEANKNLQIKLYVLKNREHDVKLKNSKLKNTQDLLIKNKELRIMNLQLQSRLMRRSQDSLLLEYSPENTDRNS